MAVLVVFGMSSSVCRGGVACFRWWLGGIATIGAALRRVVGVSGVYGCKTPRVLAQSAVHLGDMRVTWGFWGVVDDGLGVVASPCGVAGSARAVLGVFQWVRPLPMSEVVWWRGSCSACLRLFVGVVWLVFVGGLGGIATIGAALRRVVGVSGVYGRKTPRVLGRKGQRRVPVEGSMVAKPPSACSKCSRPRWNGGDMGFLGCSGRRFGRAGSWRGVFCGAACRVRRASVRAAGMIELTVGA